MIYKGEHIISGIYRGKTPVVAVYLGKRLIWQFNAINSCYAQGYWIDDMPWTDDNYWST